MSQHAVNARDLEILLAKYPAPEFTAENYAGEVYYCVLDREEVGPEEPLPLGFGWTLKDAVAEAAERINTGLDERYRNQKSK